MPLGPLFIGEGVPPVFLPDIDVYFKGNVDVALGLLETLKAARCPVLKGALIHDIDMCFEPSLDATYFDPSRGVVQENYRDVLRRHILPLPDARTIYARARELDFVIVLSVYDRRGADFAVEAGASALKVASSNITHAPLIRYLATKALPLFIDTGRSTIDEIARAVQWAREAGARHIVLQHSPEAPPAPLERHHLRMIATLANVFRCPSGLSDHHAGTDMMLAAVALGACVVEKGVRPDDVSGDLDLAHTAPVGEVESIVERLSSVWRALGDPMRTLPSHRPRPADRMAMVAAARIAEGQSLDESNVRFAIAAPMEALGAEEWDRLQGWVTARELEEGQVVCWSDLRLRPGG